MKTRRSQRLETTVRPGPQEQPSKQIALKKQSSSAHKTSKGKNRNNSGADQANNGDSLFASNLIAQGYTGPNILSGPDHMMRVPSFGDPSLMPVPPLPSSKKTGDKSSPRNGTGSLRSLAVVEPQESLIIRPTMSITKQRPQISTAEIYRKQTAQSSNQKKTRDQENLFGDKNGEISPQDDIDPMKGKANGVTHKNRGLSQQAMAKMVPNGGKRTVHEIHVEDVNKVEQKDKHDNSRRLTRQRSRTIDNQLSTQSAKKKPYSSKKIVKFTGNDSIMQNTAEERSEIGEPSAPDIQNSLMQMPSVSIFTRGAGDQSNYGQFNPSDQRDNQNLQKYLQKSTYQYDDLKDFSGYPQMSTLRPMDGSYQALNMQHSILLQRQGSVTRNRNLQNQASINQMQKYQIDPPAPQEQFSNMKPDFSGMKLGLDEQNSFIGTAFLNMQSLQPYAQESRSRRPTRQTARWSHLNVFKQSTSQKAREDHQRQMMEIRANEGNNYYGAYDSRTRNLMNQTDRRGMNRISLNVGDKQNSGGIRDDESILCPTPPNKEYAGMEFQPPDYAPGVKYFQPINFTVNVNNTGPNTMMEPYMGADQFKDQDVDQYNNMMMNKLNELPNPQEAVKSIQPKDKASSQRQNKENNKAPDSDEFIEPEQTGDFKDHNSSKESKASSKKVDIPQKKRDIKMAEKQKIQTAVQQTSSGKKTVQFNIHQQDSILKISDQGTKLNGPTPNNESPLSSKKSRTRGLGKKTLERQQTMALDPQLTLLKKRSTTVENTVCKCSKSQCLKMYCECFTIGRYCDEKCLCKNCANIEGNADKIRAARRKIRYRNPMAFKPKVQHTGPHRLFAQQQSQRAKAFVEGKPPPEKEENLKVKGRPSQMKSTKVANVDSWHINGCRCKKSNCQKKYCECFQMGVLCQPDRCQCVDCKNTKDEVQRRMDNDNFLNEFAEFIQ